MYTVLTLASLPARLNTMRTSLWLDEAWVANSILAPSWKEMFYYPRWLQPTPPLFLALARLLAKVLGPSEPALRLMPVLFGLMAIPILAIALRKLFGTGAALCGTSFVIVNLWVVRYAQQVKQFSADIFASALLLFLIVKYCRRPDRRNFTLLVVGFVVVSFLSTTAFFMGPSVIAAIAFGPLWRVSSYVQARRLKIAVVSLILFGALNYVVFIRPNRNSSLLAYWADRCLDPGHPFASARDLFVSVAEVLVPQTFPATFYLGAAIVLFMIAGIVIVLIGAAAGSRKAVVVLLLGPLPFAVAIGFSLLGLYPLLRSPRMLLWALPGCAALLAATVDQLWTTFAQGAMQWNQAPIFYSIAVACAFAALALNLAVVRYPRLNEQNSEAMHLLQRSIGPSDSLYVHGFMLQQYDYYSRLMGWAPRRVYVGNVDLPCCSRNGTNPLNSTSQSYAADLRLAAAQVQPSGQLWMFLPSHLQVSKIVATPELMQLEACHETHREGFDLALVLAYKCR